MISNSAVLLALRNRALSLVVATTGSVSLSATATGYARAAGSFVTDGFKVGMDLTATGFTTPGNNGAHVLMAVTALTLSCLGCVAEGPVGGITLASGDVVRIRESPAPYAGALVQASPGWAFCPVTIPCWIRTANAI